MNRTALLLLVFCFSLMNNICYGQVERIELNKNWTFQKHGYTNWTEAIVPGSVQSNLLRLGEIDDPHFADYEKKLAWIEEEQWIFKTNFKVEKQNKKQKFELVFNGLDTYAEVYLNGELILSADNMFRKWTIEVTEQLKEDNELKIVFTSPKEYHKGNPYFKNNSLPNDGVPERPLSRKAAYQFCWDWGPKITTIGIWRPIELVSYKSNKIEQVIIETKNLFEKKADLIAHLQMNETPTKNQYFKIYVDNEFVRRSDFHHKEVSIDFHKVQPKLWWPNGWGEANLTNIKIELYQGKKLLDTWTKNIGLRTAALINEKDSIGTSFYFKINDEPIFCKGANWIPQSHFIEQHSKADYLKLLTDAVNANMNMLRVWGGGIYEQDVFYALCDSLGIMVWQDFMFANTMIPTELNESITQEVDDNISRLANNNCIVHWCGNNEIEVAWNNWGWQKQYNISPIDSTDLSNNYDYIFRRLIPEKLEKLLPNATYSHTSPLSNWGTAANFNHSSMHYWGVFHGEDPFSEYANNVGRFNSEYGFQSFPSWKSLQSILPEEELTLDSELLAHRQKSYKGNRLIFQHLERHYPKPKDLKEISYLSQLTQAKGIKYAIQNHRINQPHCMGSLYWQLNDVWPAISWSSIDYDGEWRALHYTVKDAFDNPAIFIDTTKQKIEIALVNDGLLNYEGLLTFTLIDFEGNTLFSDNDMIYLQKQRVFRFERTSELMKVLDTVDKAKTVMKVNFQGAFGRKEQLHYFVPPKELNLNDVKPKVTVKEKFGVLELTFSSSDLIKNVAIESSVLGNFNSNYFDLLANKKNIVTFTPFEKLNLDDVLFSFQYLNQYKN